LSTTGAGTVPATAATTSFAARAFWEWVWQTGVLTGLEAWKGGSPQGMGYQLLTIIMTENKEEGKYVL
jgi:hypothetical protein